MKQNVRNNKRNEKNQNQMESEGISGISATLKNISPRMRVGNYTFGHTLQE